MAKVQRQHRRVFQADPSTRIISNPIKSKFITNGIVPDIRRQRSVRPSKSTIFTGSETVLESYRKTHKKSVK